MVSNQSWRGVVVEFDTICVGKYKTTGLRKLTLHYWFVAIQDGAREVLQLQMRVCISYFIIEQIDLSLNLCTTSRNFLSKATPAHTEQQQRCEMLLC